MTRNKVKHVQRSIRVPAAEYEAMRETIEVLQDRELMKSIARGLEDIRKGQTVPHSEVHRATRSR